jgi:dipeptidase E
MKLILASAGFQAPEAVEKCVEFVGKPADEISFGVINEAFVPYHMPHWWVIKDLIAINDNFSNNIEFVPLSLEIGEIERRLMDKDVIYVIGGNTEYLKTVFDKSGFSTLLPKLLKEKVYVGSSAGSMILGHRPTAEMCEKRHEDDDDFSVTEYLKLLDLEIIPHFPDPFFMDEAKEQLIAESEKQPCPIYGISDHSAVVVEGDKTFVIGKDYLVAEKGKIVERGE